MCMCNRDREEWIFHVAGSGDPPLPALIFTMEVSSDGDTWVEAGAATVPGTGGAPEDRCTS